MGDHLSLRFLTALFAAIFAINGTYSSIVMGGVTHLYPLDSLLLGLLYSFIGFALYFYGYKKYDGKEDHFPTEKIKQKFLKAYSVPSLLSSLSSLSGARPYFLHDGLLDEELVGDAEFLSSHGSS
jgi:hypothetical protein